MATLTAQRCLFRRSSLKRMSMKFKTMHQSTSQLTPEDDSSADLKWHERLAKVLSWNKITPETKWVLSEDISKTARKEMTQKDKWEKKIKSQSFDHQRYNRLGPELSAGQFVIANGGKIKLDGIKDWIPSTDDHTSDTTIPLPIHQYSDMKLEGLDLSGIELEFEGYRNFVNVQNVRYICVRDNTFLDDFNLTQFVTFQDSLEFLDISSCPKVTERGLAWLHHLENLKCLRLNDLKGVEDPEIVLELVSDMLPNCQVQGTIGISPDKEQTESDSPAGSS